MFQRLKEKKKLACGPKIKIYFFIRSTHIMYRLGIANIKLYVFVNVDDPTYKPHMLSCYSISNLIDNENRND